MFARIYFRELKKNFFCEDVFSQNRPDTVLNKSQMDLKIMKILREKENLHFARIYFRELRLFKNFARI